MPLKPGTRLGPYEIRDQLGAGGMGEVYRASDTRLARNVAIKVLPKDLAENQHRRERFEREAKIVSSLNHPNICALYDVGEDAGLHYLVMELVEGQTLEKKLEKGRLPLDQALQFAMQIADALDRAHRQGVVHRDLKPANIMITSSGIKLLDFGLAKLRDNDSKEILSQSQVPTQASGQLSVAGEIFGTVQYMAPEQLEGKEADARTDIFAFGGVVYEMVSGIKAFAGTSQASVISAIMTADPQPLSGFQPMAPPVLDRFVKTCLDKDPEARWQTAHDAKLQLKWINEGGTQLFTDPQGMLVQSIVDAELQSQLRRMVRRMLVPMALLVAIAGVSGWSLRNPPAGENDGRFVISASPSAPVRLSGTTTELEISPDGRMVVYSTTDIDGKQRMYVRWVDELEGTLFQVEGASNPFFSPDGNTMGFYSDGALRRISSTLVGSPTPITPVEAVVNGASWGSDGQIVFATNDSQSGLQQVFSLGRAVSDLTSPDPGEDHLWPNVLPNGKGVLFTIRRGTGRENSDTAVLNLETGDVKILIEDANQPKYAPTGHMVYSVDDELWAVAFDDDRLEIVGDPFFLHDRLVAFRSGVAPYSFSASGALVSVTGDPFDENRTLAFVDRQGEIEPIEVESRPYLHPRVSSDGTRIVVQTVEDSDLSEIWIYEIEDEGEIQPLTVGGGNVRPLWMPDIDTVTYASFQAGVWEIYSQPVDGPGDRVRLVRGDPGVQLWPESWSPDGQTLAYTKVTGEEREIWTLTLGDERGPQSFYTAPGYQVTGANFSPDGEWISFYSNRGGEYKVYILEFPSTGQREPTPVSPGQGVFPLYSPSGNELFFRRPTTAAASEG